MGTRPALDAHMQWHDPAGEGLVRPPVSAAALCALLRESLALWDIEGVVEPAECDERVDAVAVVWGKRTRIAVGRTMPGSPFAWLVRWRSPDGSERERPCASIAGILSALRLALAIERASVIRIAPSPAGDAGLQGRAPADASSSARPDDNRSCLDPSAAPGRLGSRLPGEDEAQRAKGAPRLPVTVLTGFLGSGKTTLLARLLRHPDMRRTAVIVNEFGEIGLDHELLEASDEQFVALTNGCLCCRVRSDLARTLDELFARRVRGDVPAFDRVVIETSGLAEPAPILHTLMTDVALSERYRLEAVVTTVDAVCGAETLAAHRESVNQVALADRLVVTKCDLASGNAESLDAALHSLNPSARVLRVVRGAIDPAALLAPPQRDDLQPGPLPHYRAAASGSGALHAGRDIVGISLERAEPLHAVTLSLFLSALAENCGADLLRMKGIVRIRERPEQPAVVHGVQHVFHEPDWRPAWPSSDRRTRMVFIGRRIRGKWLELVLDLLDAEVGERTRTLAERARTPA